MAIKAAIVAAVLASSIGVNAQVSSGPIYVTEYVWEECSSEEPFTITEEVTITSCPHCTETPAMPTHTTVYITAYETFCPTGLAPATYTITEYCTGETPSWPMATTNYIPPGFTTTVTECHVCGEYPITATLTIPCEKCKKGPAGPPATPTPPGGSTAGPGGPPASNTPVGPGSMYTASYPYPASMNGTAQECGGGSCGSAATGGLPPVSSGGSNLGPGANSGASGIGLAASLPWSASILATGAIALFAYLLW